MKFNYLIGVNIKSAKVIESDYHIADMPNRAITCLRVSNERYFTKKEC